MTKCDKKWTNRAMQTNKYR